MCRTRAKSTEGRKCPAKVMSNSRPNLFALANVVLHFYFDSPCFFPSLPTAAFTIEVYCGNIIIISQIHNEIAARLGSVVRREGVEPHEGVRTKGYVGLTVILPWTYITIGSSARRVKKIFFFVSFLLHLS